MSGMRNRLAEGLSRIQAARLTTAEFAPIILAAGLLVAAGTASLGVARMQLIRAFGPALAVTVLTAMLVSLTLAPALIGIFGSALSGRDRAGSGWPGRRPAGRPRRRPPAGRLGAGTALPVALSGKRLARFAAVRPVALVIVAGCVLGLLGGRASTPPACGWARRW